MSIEDALISDRLLQDKEGKSSPPHWSEKFGKISASPKTVALAGTCCGLLALVGMLPKSATSYLSSIFMRTNQGANTIHICAQEMIVTTPQPADGAFVHCWDKDASFDDLMVEGTTGDDGCATLTYADQSWDGAGGRSPDILCIVDKNGFVEAAPPRLDHHDQTTLAEMEAVTLYRDRSNDYGHDNGCGPHWSEAFGINDFMAWATRFGEYCTHHDKCYWDCQIFLASNSAEEAQAFCDTEMHMGMKSFCHAHRGNTLVGTDEASCLLRADAIHAGLSALGGIMAYDKTSENCPNNNGETDPSMENDYSHPDCHLDGFQCGYDGTTGDDLDECNECCNESTVLDGGTIRDDHYCKCLPAPVQCGTTLTGFSHDHCDQCCNPGKNIVDGYFYDDYFCNA